MSEPDETRFSEKIFDRRFREKPVVDYEEGTGKPGRRDAQTIRQLEEFGLDGTKCLDIGPGTGRWMQFLWKKGASHVAAVDFSQEVLRRVGSIASEVHKVDVERERLPFDDDEFDVTLAFMVMEHLKDPNLFLDEIIRVTRPSGLALLTIPNIASFRSRIRLLLGLLPVAVAQDRTHVGFYTSSELRALFTNRNANVEVIPTGFSLHPFDLRKLQIPTGHLLAGLDDNRLFRIHIR